MDIGAGYYFWTESNIYEVWLEGLICCLVKLRLPVDLWGRPGHSHFIRPSEKPVFSWFSKELGGLCCNTVNIHGEGFCWGSSRYPSTNSCMVCCKRPHGSRPEFLAMPNLCQELGFTGTLIKHYVIYLTETCSGACRVCAIWCIILSIAPDNTMSAYTHVNTPSSNTGGFIIRGDANEKGNLSPLLLPAGKLVGFLF